MAAINLDNVSYDNPQLKVAKTVFVDMDQKIVNPDQLFLCVDKSKLAGLQLEDNMIVIETHMELKPFEKPLDNQLHLRKSCTLMGLEGEENGREVIRPTDGFGLPGDPGKLIYYRYRCFHQENRERS
jgi:hypothetical protein